MIWHFRTWQVTCLKQILTNATYLNLNNGQRKDVFLRKRSRQRCHVNNPLYERVVIVAKSLTLRPAIPLRYEQIMAYEI